jgi:HK97 family phage major capsid protein
MTLKHVFGVGLAAVVVLAVVSACAELAAYSADSVGVVAAMAITALPAALPRDLVSLQRLRAAAYQEMEAALASGTEDRQKDFDVAGANVDRLDAEIANAERLNKLKGNGAIGTIESENLDPAQAKSFMAKYRHLPASAHVVEKGQVFSQAQQAAFADMLTSVARAYQGRGVDPLLIEASTGGNESVDADGRFLVEKDLFDGLMRRTFEVARIAGRARRIPISAKANGLKINALKDDSRATGSRWGGIQMYRIGEGDSLTPSRPKFRQMNLELKKYAGLCYATSELLQDTTAFASVISQAYPDELAFMLDDDMFEGGGTNSNAMLGFMNANCKVSITKETGQAARTIVKENIDKMWSRLRPASIPTSEWWMNSDCFPQLNSLSQVIGTGGVPVYLPPGGLSASPFGTLLGRPVLPIEYCNTLGTEGDIVLADPTQYVMIDKGDIQYATSIHVAFLTDEQAFRFIYRVDGQPVDDKPITPFKGTNTQSTFVTLATRG